MPLHFRAVLCTGRTARAWACIFLLLAFAAESAAQQATLLADAHVSSARPSANAGSLSNLNVGGGYTAFLQFDLGTLPAGLTAAQVTRATLRLYCNRADSPGSFSAQLLTSAWSEGSVTYATEPSAATTIAASASCLAADQFVTLDLTSAVQSWVTAPASNFGLALTASAAVLQFDSKENDFTGHAPELDVMLATGSGSGLPGATGATGATGAPGPAGLPGAQGPPGVAGPVGPAGATGAPGATGTPGMIGATGVTGATGAQGPPGPSGSGLGATGPTGATGAAGSPGLIYQGAYSSVTNYALGDVVLFAGSSYVSLQAANHGNTPGQSPAYWGALTAQGPTGATGASGSIGPTGPQGLPGSVGPPGEKGDTGAQGLAGQAGAQGIPGATGATGLQGPLGATGPAGPTGLNYRGAYNSQTNYALADGVLWQGAGYVSLIANNHGNTPSESPTDWSLFAASGVAGPAGPAGPQGVTGATGATGIGTVGATGPTGATGLQGIPGLLFQGPYASATNYALNDAVSYLGSSYISLHAGNHGNTPDQSPADWSVLAAQGIAGAVGATGSAGPTGPAGLSGAAGATGPQGPPVSFIGGWLTTRAYAVGDAVNYLGSSYIAVAANSGRQPDISPLFWLVLAAAGSTGPAGATGATGFQGPTGYPGATGATGATGSAGTPGAPGATGATGPQGVAGNPGLPGAPGAVGPAGPAGPAGATGATGSPGAAGTPGLNFRGAWAANLTYTFNDAVTFAGSTYLALAINSNAQPDLTPQSWSLLAQAGSAGSPGSTGPPGAAGPAATITIAPVTVLPAGSQPTVTNTGTSSAAVLAFGLPAGGSGSTTAATGSSFAAMYHPVSYNTIYYAPNTPNAAATETAAVMAWVPRGCSATRLDVYSQQSGQIKVTLRSGTPGNMADTPLLCNFSGLATASCSITGAVTIAPGAFLDFRIDNASSTPAGVWTSLECN